MEFIEHPQQLGAGMVDSASLLGAVHSNDAESGACSDISLLDRLARWADESPESSAYIFLGNDGSTEAQLRVTYGELADRVTKMADRLSTLVQHGDRVLLLLPTDISYVVAFLACLARRAIAVPLYMPGNDREWSRAQLIANDCKPSAAVVLGDPGEFKMHLPDVPKWLDFSDAGYKFSSQPTTTPIRFDRCRSNDIAFIQYTSGSTGNPKGVMVSNANLIANARSLARAVGNDKNTVHVSFLPLYHDMGLIGMVLQSLFIGGSTVLMSPYRFIRKPLAWLQAISDYRARTAGAPNFAYDLCVAKVNDKDLEALDLSCWEVAYNGSEPVRAATLERFAQRFALAGFSADAFVPAYGLAEATLFVSGSCGNCRILALHPEALAQGRVETSTLPQGATPIVSCGEVIDGDVRIVDPESWRTCAPGRIGEIWFRSDSVTGGYWAKPFESARKFHCYTIDAGEGPFLSTGDLGFVADGQLYVTGRIKDLIIVNGVNHYPHDIEDTVQSLSEIFRRDAGAAFADAQERLVIVQGLQRTNLSQTELNALLASVRQAVWHRHGLPPSQILFVKPGEIAKTSSGKIQRNAMRRRLEENGFTVLAAWYAPDVTAPLRAVTSAGDTLQTRQSSRRQQDELPELRSYIRSWVAERAAMELHLLQDDTEFAAIGLGSLDAVDLSACLTERYGSEFEPTILFNYPTIERLRDFVANKILSDEVEVIRAC